MKTVIEMAMQSGFWREHIDTWMCSTKDLEAFAELVRADERNSWPAEMEAMERQVNILTDALAEERDRMKWDVHSCGPTCKRYACVAMREAVAAVREACAKVCDEQAERSKLAMEKSKRTTDHAVYRAGAQTAAWNAAEIRARGSKT